MSDNSNEGVNAFGAIVAVAHELRTPLTAIQGAVELLHDEAAGPLTPAQREFVDLAHRNLARLKDRIEDALDIAAGQKQGWTETATVNLEEIAQLVSTRTAVEAGPTVRIRFSGFRGELLLSIPERTLCRMLASVSGTIFRHAATGEITAQATVTEQEVQFAIEASRPAAADAALGHNAVMHDASLALAREVVQVHQGTLLAAESGRCGVYVLLPLRSI